MKKVEFNELYNDVLVRVSNKEFSQIVEDDIERYKIYLTDLKECQGIKLDVKRNYNSNIDRVDKQGFFKDNVEYSNFIKISSMCDVLLKYKLVCYTITEQMPTYVLIINYKIVIEFVKQSVVLLLNKEYGKEKEIINLKYPSEDFEEIILLSLIINDNTKLYKFDILNFASVLLLLYEFNKEKDIC